MTTASESLHPSAVEALACETAIRERTDRQLLEEVLDVQREHGKALRKMFLMLQSLLYARLIWPGVVVLITAALGGAVAYSLWHCLH